MSKTFNIKIQTQTNQTQLITNLIINKFHFNFIILNNKLIFTHKITKKQINKITKLLNQNYLNKNYQLLIQHI